MRTALVVGNGFSNSLLQHLGSDLDSSNPLRWPVITPGRESRLIDDLPYLKAYVEKHNPEHRLTDFQLFARLVENLSDSPTPDALPDDEQGALLDACHFLAVSFGWFQLKIDGRPISDWSWARWMADNYMNVIAALSWNYDLVLERTFEHSKTPYFYPGIATPSDAPDLVSNRRAVMVAKPHGSCNFAPPRGFMFSVEPKPGEPAQILSYPRLIDVWAGDGTIEVLLRDRLYSIRQVADLVLPGEWNRFGKYLNWVGKMTQCFSDEIHTADQLLIVGFSMMESDRPEFLNAIDRAKSLECITVADPSPNPALIDALRGRSKQLILWRDGPFGKSEVIST